MRTRNLRCLAGRERLLDDLEETLEWFSAVRDAREELAYMRHAADPDDAEAQLHLVS